MPHPEAQSELLGVREEQHAATFQRWRLDPDAHAEAAKSLVVRISSEHAGGLARGSGVIVCTVGRDAYVLTARHVLTGEDGSGDGAEGFFADTHEVEFFRNAIAPQVDRSDAFGIRLADDMDLALLRLRLPPAAIPPPLIALSGSDSLRPGDPVLAIGNPRHGASTWNESPGRVISSRGALSYSPAVPQGFSGGPVFDASGRLAGVNVRNRDGRAMAIPIESAYGRALAWLPQACPRGPW